MWQHYINALIGLWVIISPFVGFAGDSLSTDLVISGILLIIFSLWGAASSSYQKDESSMHSRA
ncbi:MAG: SPW repeat protein [Candidatus Paceibacterota bacterium]|jgi:FtsH-binding integral membrane protein